MNNTPFVTVVMPVYNAASSLGKAIKSLQKQTYEDWELICVNDGSTDTSLEMLNCFAAIDRRIKVLSQENGGAASARRTAYRACCSEYIFNLDADDEISPDFLEECIRTAKETGADVVVPNCISITPRGHSMDWNEAYGYSVGQTMSGQDAMRCTFVPSTMHGHLVWKISLIKQYACPDSDEYIHLFCEDEYFWRVLFWHSGKVVFSKGDYIYNCSTSGLTKRFKRNHTDYFQVCRQLLSLADAEKMPEDIVRQIWEYYFRVVFNVQLRLDRFGKYSLSKSERASVKEEIKKAYQENFSHRDMISFSDKSHSSLMRFATLSAYPLFKATCKAVNFIRSL